MFNRGTGFLLLRLFTGIRLIYGVWDNIYEWDRMNEFSSFLAGQNFPVPMVCAVLSVYAQFICGILFIIGWKIRWAAAVMIINFLVASSVHINESFEAMTPALAFLFISILFFFEGGGLLSIDKGERKI